MTAIRDEIALTSCGRLPSVKMDPLYKPLLRRFRAHFRQQFDEGHNKKLYQHWSIETYLKQVRRFMIETINVPTALQDYEHVIKMLTLLFPCSTRKPLPELSTIVDRVVFVEVFRENNTMQRSRFFSDPLIKHLW